MKGGAGQACNEACGALGKVCNSTMQSTITTNELVANAFLEAGYSCKSFHPPRGYAGVPFSQGTSNDCAPINSGATSVCTTPYFNFLSALCYCDGGDQN